jgi:hydrophobic/amphiphilic exporter-1 (mainly G- bacteria), HAE1 family
LLASFVVAMTVIPLFCSRFLKAAPHAHGADGGGGHGFNAWFNRGFNAVLNFYERAVRRSLKHPALTIALLSSAA